MFGNHAAAWRAEIAGMKFDDTFSATQTIFTVTK